MDGDFATANNQRSAWLAECTAALTDVECASISAGSIVLVLQSLDEDSVQAAADDITTNGLSLPSFGIYSILGMYISNKKKCFVLPCGEK